MKKLLVLSALACTAASVYAQGFATFNNFDPATPVVRSPIYLLTVGGAAPSGTDTQFRAALLGGTTGTPFAFITGSRTNSASGANSAGSLSLLASPNTGNATWATFRTGTAAGFVAVGSDSPRVVPGVDFGGTAEVQVVAWSGGFSTWAQAYAAWLVPGSGVLIGASNPLTVVLPASATDPNIARLVGLESFAMVANVIPEPTTFALAGLGAAAMMIFRRRK